MFIGDIEIIETKPVNEVVLDLADLYNALSKHYLETVAKNETQNKEFNLGMSAGFTLASHLVLGAFNKTPESTALYEQVVAKLNER